MAVGIVIVSHSEALAEAALALAQQMAQDPPPVALAAGLSDGSLGTDATRVMTAIDQVRSEDGVAVFADMGSALMSAETAVDLLGEGPGEVRVLAAPLVEGLTAGLVRASFGEDLDSVAEAAESALDAKREALGLAPRVAAPPISSPDDGEEVQLVNSVGMHARPAARLATLANKYDAEVLVAFGSKGPVNAKSTMSLMTLGAKQGDHIRISATGAQAAEAQRAIIEFVAGGMDEA